MMLRKSLTIVCILAISLSAFADKKKKKKADEAMQTEASVDGSKPDYKSPGAPLPPVRVLINKKLQYNKDMESDGNLMIMLFNPTCEHCQEQTLAFEKNIFLFKKTKLYLIAANVMTDYMDYFENVVHYSKYPSINVGLDSNKLIDKVFLYQALPQINIYDKERKLIKVFSGEIPMDSLKKYID